MDLDRAIRERLSALSGLVGEPDLSVVALDLARSAQAAVPSFLALRVTIQDVGQTITVATDASSAGKGVVRSSLRLDTATAGEAGHQLSMVYLAGRYGAFVEFVALSPCVPDTSPGFGIQFDRLVIDGDVPAGRMAGFAAEDPSVIGAEADQRVMERAIGALMGCGFTPEAARVELATRADYSHWTTIEEAQALLLSLRGTVPGADDPGPLSP